MIQTLLVDDQPPIRTGFKTILEIEPGIEVTGEAGDGTRGAELALELCPDVVYMDVQMSRMNRTGATCGLTSRGYGSTVPILTAFSRDDFLFETLQAGALGFLLETAEAEKLIEAMQILGRDEGLLSPQVTRWVIKRLTAPRQGPRCPGRTAAGVLTEHKHGILPRLARDLSNAEITAEMFVNPEAVKTHMSNILTKLGLRDRINVVIQAYGSGLVPRSS